MESQTPMSPPPGSPPLDKAAIEQKVAGPAIALIVTAIIGIFFQLISLLINVFSIGMLSKLQEMQPSQSPEGFEMFTKLFTGAFAVVGFILALIVTVLMIIGGIRMKKLQSWSLALTASILAMIPCLSPCCIIGIPIGIWALVVLMKPEVKAAFQ